jgi:hypothetical protein
MRSSSTMKPPRRAAGSDESRRGRSFCQSTTFLRLKTQVEYVAATMLSARAVGRISDGGKAANAINARNAVPPAWPTVAYSSEMTPKSRANNTSIPIAMDAQV